MTDCPIFIVPDHTPIEKRDVTLLPYMRTLYKVLPTNNHAFVATQHFLRRCHERLPFDRRYYKLIGADNCFFALYESEHDDCLGLIYANIDWAKSQSELPNMWEIANPPMSEKYLLLNNLLYQYRVMFETHSLRSKTMR